MSNWFMVIVFIIAILASLANEKHMKDAINEIVDKKLEQLK